MNHHLIQQAYNNLIAKPDSNKDNILYRLSDWLTDFLDDDKDKVLYFSLPIWDYLQNMWNPHFPMCISKQNDSYMRTQKGWYKNYKNDKNIDLKKTDFGKFYSESDLKTQGFSFVEFITQNATSLKPIFTIQFIDDPDGITRFELNVDSGCLSLVNSSADKDNSEAFVDATSKLLLAEKGHLTEGEKRDLASLYSFLSIYQQQFPGLQYIYLITSRLFNVNSRNLSSGGLILVCREALDPEKLNLISFIVNLCYREKGGKNWEERCLRESIKSAKAAIMSRNMSHNLGSHVMSYLKQHLSSVSNMLNDRVLADLFLSSADFPKRFKDDKKDVEEKIAMPFLLGLGQFISYLQERQDFIATIATDFIPYNSNVNFKDHIYDELNPDKRYERHSQHRVIGKKIDNILLGNIARSEGLGRSSSSSSSSSGVTIDSITSADSSSPSNSLSDIVLKFKNFNGNSANSSKEKQDLVLMRDLEVALPGGVVGRQAIFSIVENVIRNAAKHGHWRNNKQLELTFDCFTKKTIRFAAKDDNYDDNHKSLKGVLEDLYAPGLDSDELYFFTLTDNSDSSPDVLVKLREAIAEDYVNSAGELKNGNKGIKEMRISASWLRSLRSDYEPHIDNKTDTDLRHDINWKLRKDSFAPVLYARLSKAGGKSRLQYIFCLLIPKRIAFISQLINEKKSGKKMNSCCFYSSIDSFLELRDISYEFIVFDDLYGTENKYKEKQYEKLRMNSSSRLIKLSSLTQEDIRIIKPVIQKGAISVKQVTAIELLLLKYWAKYDENEKNPMDCILIQDNSSRKGEDIQIVEGETKLADSRKYYYIYRAHHETVKQFKEYFKNFHSNYGSIVGSIANVVYVEGITGDNSTDRLIRRTDIDKEWFYRHLHAMKSNVAIIDERLFANIYGLEETDLKIKQENGLEQIATYNVLADLEAEFGFSNVNSSILKVRSERDTKDYKPTTLLQKGVYIFNLIQSAENPDEFILYGLKMDSFSEIRNRLSKDSYRSTCVQLLKLSWNDNELNVDPLPEWKKHYQNLKFDYLSIHQGILDKLYTVFKIHKKDSNKKEILTKDLYQKTFFKYRKSDIIPYANETKFFLPGMCIHSGRSKPDVDDMPQRLPFIQYSAIEHAVQDCKYSLVELLDFARYQL